MKYITLFPFIIIIFFYQQIR